MNTPIWDDGKWQALPTLQQPLEADLCIVGLGGSGLAAVLKGLALGQRVIGLEAGMIAGGAAGRNGGFLLAGTAAFYHQAVAALGRERARTLYQLTQAEIKTMYGETPEAIRLTGSLRIASSAEEKQDCLAQLAAMQTDALPVEPYEGAEGSGLLFPEDAVFNPLLRCRILAQRALAQGALLFENSRVVSLAEGMVKTKQASVRAKKIIVAVDGGLERIFPELQGRVRTARLQMLATAPTRNISIPRAVYLRYGYEYYQQLASGSIALGGFRDKAGEEEWTFEKTPTKKVQAMLEGFLREKLGITAPISHRWAASVAYSKGILPILEELRPGVWAVGGYSGTGNVIGALYGKAATEEAITGHSAIAKLFRL